MAGYLEPGRVIRYRTYFGSALCDVAPARVVRHDAAGLVTWVAAGTPILHRAHPDGRALRDVPRAKWPDSMEPAAWFGAGVLRVTPPDVGHAVWWFRQDEPIGAGAFRGWYVNLERHAVWVDGEQAGVDVVDQELDGWVTPDRSWSWKDEESFAAKTGEPAFWSVAEATEVRAEGERVRTLAESGAAPFDGTWCDFRPDPSWSLPSRPVGAVDRPPALPLTGAGGVGTGGAAAR